jgi:chromosome partitioning protein
VLLIDIDPQGNASSALGFSRTYSRNNNIIGISEVLLGRVPLHAAIYPYANNPNLSLCPSNDLLVGLPQELPYLTNPNVILKNALHPLKEEYDYIILDCPPSLNLLTINALCAAQELIIPMQTEFFAMEGLGSLLQAIELVQKNLNPSLKIGGIVLNMVNSSALCEEICIEVKKHFPDIVFPTSIPRTIKIPEAQSHALLLQEYAPHSKGARAYNMLAQELIARHQNQKDSSWVSPSLGEA